MADMTPLPPSDLACLRVFLPLETSATAFSWMAFDAAGKFRCQGASGIADLPAADKLELVIPAPKLAAHRLTLPQQAQKYQDALIAQALEDRLLAHRQDILAVPGPASGEERILWVCVKSWLEAHLEGFVQAQRPVDRVLTLYELLPESSSTLHYANLGEYLIFRSKNNEFGIAEDLAMLSLLFGEGDAEKTAVPDCERLPCSVPSANWLTGPLSRFRSHRFDWTSLRPLAVLLAAVLLLGLADQLILWRQLENRSAALRHEIRQSFAALFPGTPIVDPLLQWEGQLRENASVRHDDALDTLFALSAKIDAPIKPKLVEVNDKQARITLSDTQAAQFKEKLDRAGACEKTPAEQGWTRLQCKLDKR